MRRLVFVLMIIAALLQMNAQKKGEAQPKAQAAQKNSTAAASQTSDRGERVFRENCSRCHNAPEGFSPRISGTIVRHMRVRANLSAKDAQALMRFFNPQ